MDTSSKLGMLSNFAVGDPVDLSSFKRHFLQYGTEKDAYNMKLNGTE